MAKKLSTIEFKEQLQKEHPNLLLLSDYEGNKKYVTVKCIKHNYIFKTKPNWLHSGKGCKKCYDERRGNSTRKQLEQFIEESNKIHKNKYDYSKSDYVNNKHKICIICPEHGEFWQTPNKHLSGQGCPKCSGKNISTNEWIEKVKQIHNFKYDYSKTEYINNSTKVCIICPEHGEFWQTPDKHSIGEGCPHCNSSKLEKSVKQKLNEANIKIEEQKQFDWLGKQKLDFFLPEFNLAIECQGRQHFTPIKHFGGIDGYNKTVNRDIIKYNLCKENNIYLIYIINKKDLTLLKSANLSDIYHKNVITIEKDKSKLISEKINKIKNILK